MKPAMKLVPITCAALLALAGCGQSGEDQQPSGDDVANQLEQAAEQSSPGASEALETAADQAREQDSMAPVGDPSSFAQRAMETAAAADATGAPPTR